MKALLEKLVNDVVNVEGEDVHERRLVIAELYVKLICDAERTGFASKLMSELIDESNASTIASRDPIQHLTEIARDLGYRAGHNDRARSFAKFLRGETDK